jgi:hypothetical protein
MGVGTLTQRLRHLRLLRFPAFAATASRWRPKTPDPGASLREAKRYGLAPPPPKTASALRGLPSHYCRVIAAAKARRLAPVMWDAARRRSVVCDGLSDGPHVQGARLNYTIFAWEER